MLCAKKGTCYHNEKPYIYTIQPYIYTFSTRIYAFFLKEKLRNVSKLPLFISGASAASSRNIDHLLGKNKNGKAVIIIIGGAREVLCQDHDHIDLILLKRKGFIKKGINKCLNP